jgi:outer membrane biogenesis lipoprotein LolB
MKRLGVALLISLLLGVAVFALTGCSPTDDNENNESQKTQFEKPTLS